MNLFLHPSVVENIFKKGMDYFNEEKFFEEKIKPYLSDKIEYLGAVNFQEKNELYKNALATLAPLSWHEPFGLTIVESQACGTPVIAFRKGAAPEIIKHGETGFVVETEEQMIDAIGSINTINRESCRKWVETNFSVKKMVDEYEKFYASLIT
jgi:glycosyltransferase involved in cell wall biosynthesis